MAWNMHSLFTFDIGHLQSSTAAYLFCGRRFLLKEYISRSIRTQNSISSKARLFATILVGCSLVVCLTSVLHFVT